MGHEERAVHADRALGAEDARELVPHDLAVRVVVDFGLWRPGSAGRSREGERGTHALAVVEVVREVLAQAVFVRLVEERGDERLRVRRARVRCGDLYQSR